MIHYSRSSLYMHCSTQYKKINTFNVNNVRIIRISTNKIQMKRAEFPFPLENSLAISEASIEKDQSNKRGSKLAGKRKKLGPIVSDGTRGSVLCPLSALAISSFVLSALYSLGLETITAMKVPRLHKDSVDPSSAPETDLMKVARSRSFCSITEVRERRKFSNPLPEEISLGFSFVHACRNNRVCHMGTGKFSDSSCSKQSFAKKDHVRICLMIFW